MSGPWMHMKYINEIKKIGIARLLLICSLMLLIGCGCDTKDSSTQLTEYTYFPEYVEIRTLEPEVDMIYADCVLSGDILYYSAGEKTDNGYRYVTMMDI